VYPFIAIFQLGTGRASTVGNLGVKQTEQAFHKSEDCAFDWYRKGQSYKKQDSLKSTFNA